MLLLPALLFEPFELLLEHYYLSYSVIFSTVISSNLRQNDCCSRGLFLCPEDHPEVTFVMLAIVKLDSILIIESVVVHYFMVSICLCTALSYSKACCPAEKLLCGCRLWEQRPVVHGKFLLRRGWD